MSESMAEERAHAWVMRDSEDPDPHPYWEERRCTTCGLEDMRVRADQRNGCGVRANWKVKTPCIDPVVDEISFDALLSEMKANKMKEHPHVEGHPGKWQVGLGAGGNYPHIECDKMEHGFALLLRWLRARQFDPHKHSNYYHAKQLAEPEHRYYDD